MQKVIVETLVEWFGWRTITTNGTPMRDYLGKDVVYSGFIEPWSLSYCEKEGFITVEIPTKSARLAIDTWTNQHQDFLEALHDYLCDRYEDYDPSLYGRGLIGNEEISVPQKQAREWYHLFHRLGYKSITIEYSNEDTTLIKAMDLIVGYRHAVYGTLSVTASTVRPILEYTRELIGTNHDTARYEEDFYTEE